MGDLREATAPGFSELAEQFFHAAERVVESHGLRFGQGADVFLQQRAAFGAKEIIARSNGDISTLEARRLIDEAQTNFTRFAEAMVKARLEVPDRTYFALDIVGEETLRRAHDWLCPLFPIC
jgi:hypothetical protein